MTYPSDARAVIDLMNDDEAGPLRKQVMLGRLLASGTEPTGLPVPQHLKEGLDQYAKNRIPTGGFLVAVLENDLKSALQAADRISMLCLPAIVSYIYNDLPAGCWGSPEKVQAWLAGRITER